MRSAWLVLAALFALPTLFLAESQAALPGCDTPETLRLALAEKLDDRFLAKLKYADRLQRTRAVYEELIATYPRESRPYIELIGHERGHSAELTALQGRFKRQAVQRPDDPFALYLAGVALFGTDTPESLRLLEASQAKAPRFASAALVLAYIYSSDKSVNKPKAAANLTKYFDSCPASTDPIALALLARSRDEKLQKRIESTLRSQLEKETDPARLRDYATLWRLEFNFHPVQEHEFVRREIATDVQRIAELNRKPDPSWLAFLVEGSRQAGLAADAITALQDRIVREYPQSPNAYWILLQRWKKANPQPGDSADAGAWDKYRRAYQEALLGWKRDFPDEITPETWFDAVFDDDSLTEKDGIAALDDYLRYNSEYRELSDLALEHAAVFLLQHGWQATRALEILNQARSLLGVGQQVPYDNYPADTQAEIEESQLTWDYRLKCLMLQAALQAGRPEAVTAIRATVEEAPPASKKQTSVYWWNRARLARLENRRADAVVYYRLALQTRNEVPPYKHGKLRDDLTDEIQALWKELGGTLNTWNLLTKATEVTETGGWKEATRTLPEFDLEDLSGKHWRLKDLKGKSVLINVWATWCSSCAAELPRLQKLYDQLSGRNDVQILTFNLDENLGMVEPYIKNKGFTFPVLPAYALVNDLLDGNTPIPQTWLLDASGTWQLAQVGYGEEAKWEEMMMRKLAQVQSGDQSD